MPALIERARREIALARVVGKFTVDFGIRRVRRRLDRDGVAGAAAIESVADLNDQIEQIEHVEQVDVVEPDAVSTTPTTDDLVLPDYDHLPAAHVVAKLASLTPSERDAVEQYERATRHRRTILGKLEQLRAGT